MSALLGPQIVEGNKVDTLLNGDQIFPAMLTAIQSAKRTITFETYIYWSGTIGQEPVDTLSERSRAGVKVHVLLDWGLVGADVGQAGFIAAYAALRAGRDRLIPRAVPPAP